MKNEIKMMLQITELIEEYDDCVSPNMTAESREIQRFELAKGMLRVFSNSLGVRECCENGNFGEDHKCMKQPNER